jgi:Region found in RelA / SpoT proteins
MKHFIYFITSLLLINFNLCSVVSVSNHPSIKTNHASIYSDQNIDELNLQVLQVAEKLGGGVFDSQIDAIVPFFPSQARQEWLQCKNDIAKRIGYLFPRPSKNSEAWENSARTADELIHDAENMSVYFREKCTQIAEKVNGVANFGVKDQSIVKSKENILRKVKKISRAKGISEEEAIAKVRDALRGTIIVEYPEQIPAVTEAIKEFAVSQKREITFLNIWEDARLSGYVGVHAKMLLPIYENNNKTERNIIIEIQIHLKCLMDGTKNCAKERTHPFYEDFIGDKKYLDVAVPASLLLFLTGLKNCPPPNKK